MPSAPAPLVEKRFRSITRSPFSSRRAVARCTSSRSDHRRLGRAIQPLSAQSKLSALNRAAGTTFTSSQWMFGAARTAVEAARATDGLFDPLLASRMAELHTHLDDLPFRDRPALWPRGAPACGGRSSIRLATPFACHAAPEWTSAGSPREWRSTPPSRASSPPVEYAAVNAGGDLAVHGLPSGSPRGQTWSRARTIASSRLRRVRSPPPASCIVAGGSAANSVITSSTRGPASRARATCWSPPSPGAAALRPRLPPRRHSSPGGRPARRSSGRKLAGLLVAADASRWPVGRWSDHDRSHPQLGGRARRRPARLCAGERIGRRWPPPVAEGALVALAPLPDHRASSVHHPPRSCLHRDSRGVGLDRPFTGFSPASPGPLASHYRPLGCV